MITNGEIAPPAPQKATGAQTAGLRMELRRATRGEHDAAEAAFAPFHAAPAQHLSWFLGCQLVALRPLYALAGRSGAQAEALIGDLLKALEQDCADRGWHPAPVAGHGAQTGRALDGLAIDYLVLGSRLGTEVLRRRLMEEADDPLPAYFAPRPHKDMWQQSCRELDAIPADSLRAKRLIDDTRTGFSFFYAAARANPIMIGTDIQPIL